MQSLWYIELNNYSRLITALLNSLGSLVYGNGNNLGSGDAIFDHGSAR